MYRVQVTYMGLVRNIEGIDRQRVVEEVGQLVCNMLRDATWGSQAQVQVWPLEETPL